MSALVDWPMGGAGDHRFDVAIAIEHDDDDDLVFTDDELAAFWSGHGSAPLDAATLRWFRRLWDFF